MEVSQWLTQHWFELTETLSVLGGLTLTTHAFHKDKKSRKISNLIAINQQYGSLWREFYEKPELKRVLQNSVDLNIQPLTDQECFFVKRLILHLDSVRRATQMGVFVKIEGLQQDIRDLFERPVP